MFSIFDLNRRELRISLVILVVQFVNIVDFMMIMPLGPDLAKALGIPYDALGIITAAYVLVAATTTFFLARYLDVLSRSFLLAVCVLFLGITLLITPWLGLSFGLTGLIVARGLSGLFGGPATSLALAIISDSISPEKRGRSIGLISGSFSLAAILGVPICLWLSELGDWRTPFQILGIITIVVGCGLYFFLPTQVQSKRTSIWIGNLKFLYRIKTALTMAIVFFTSFCGFLFIPNLATYIQLNLGYPRDLLALLYAIGGGCTLISLQIAGWAVDRYRPLPSAIVFSIGSALTVIVMFGFSAPLIPIIFTFSLLMMFNSARSVLANTLSSLVPNADERGAHMAFQSTLRHLGTASGAVIGAFVLSIDEYNKLENIGVLLTVYLIFLCVPPWLIWKLEQTQRNNK